ncbi:hypothetical protein FOA43_002248 [Brettanomyces nanus]|uniref:Uncharacterized protein n=1 Tax=Eeniella nana TaxID=13502 RepID=A0A875RPD5_EENNA|nr:uncharacterized protein FOA43_002248 [Brettanomyces nanus]QPG74910.1 hypothetical protein FOA43_002248 [Brettanomyces nanus]
MAVTLDTTKGVDTSHTAAEDFSRTHDNQTLHDSDTGEGPSFDSNGIPYNYIIIIDAGSKGSRAYIYNYLNTGYMEKNGFLTPGKLVDGITMANKLPYVHSEAGWNKKIRPGLSSFRKNVHDEDSTLLVKTIGEKYLSKLLKKAVEIVPTNLQNKTPIFVHATAGLRLLDESEQNAILSATCQYIQSSTEFYMPKCSEHVSTIQGDEEGLYGWIAMNYLAGTLRKGEKSHGLLELGGASTQISFVPNETERKEHHNELMTLKLANIGSKEADMEYEVYSKSFLGYGMHQIHLKYLEQLSKEVTGDYASLVDPCLPYGYHKEMQLNVRKRRIVGSGDSSECQSIVYRTLASGNLGGCDEKNKLEVSKCLLNDTIPAFDFNFENFYGVSGYWDTISNLLDLGKVSSSEYEKYGKMYSYSEIQQETSKVCSLGWKQLQSYRDIDNEEDLADLCFKSTYMTSLLHNGLGLTKNGTAKFQINDKINGTDFTWTLGRAVLYASDEAQLETGGESVGYSRNSAAEVFIKGSEEIPGSLASGTKKTGSSSNESYSLLSLLVLVLLAFVLLLRRPLVLRIFKGIVNRLTKGKKYRRVSIDDIETANFDDDAIKLRDIHITRSVDTDSRSSMDSMDPMYLTVPAHTADPFRIDDEDDELVR